MQLAVSRQCVKVRVVLRSDLTWHATSRNANRDSTLWGNGQEYEDRSPPRAREDSMPSFKEEEEQDASPKAPPPVEEAPPPPPEPAPVEPVGDLLVGFIHWKRVLFGMQGDFICW